MKRNEFKEWALSSIRYMDGSTGVALMSYGMPGNAIPEKYILENPNSLLELQKDYISAGTDILLTATLGTNSEKLSQHKMDDVEYVNREIVKISKQAASKNGLVAVELGPSGQFMYPMGMKTFDEIVDMYKEQVKYSLMEDPDLFTLETFIDLSEARAAVIAIRELCDLPIIASMTFENGMSLSGNSPEAVAITLEAAGADAVGANCSTGPDGIADIISKMAKVTNLPLFAKPNAGMPEIKDGKTVFPMGADEFAKASLEMIKAGASIIGGCCGTYPLHIQKLVEITKDMLPIKREWINDIFISSTRDVINISSNDKFIPIGERINPTGQPALAKSFVDGDIMPAIDLAGEQIRAGVKILDVNVGAAGADEAALLKQLAIELPVYAPCAVCFDSTNVLAMENALKTFCGRAILNSVSIEKNIMEPMMELAIRYGAVVILLPFVGKMDLTCQDRIDVLNILLECATKYNIGKDQIIIDATIMSASTNQNAPMESINFVKHCKNLGYLTIAGVSNVSFGLPNRDAINEAYLLQLIQAGLDIGIVLPCEGTNRVINTSFLLSGKDEYCMNWIGESRK